MTWREQAACLGLDHRIFFPEYSVGSGASITYEPARKICHDCPVAEECLEDALRRPRSEDLGVRGGFTSQERQNIRWNRNRRRRLETA